MQINHSNSVTRAGALRGSFGPGPRHLSPIKLKPNLGAYGSSSLALIPEIGTEETVIRTNKDLKMSHSPSICDINVQRDSSQVAGASSSAANALENKSEQATDAAFFSLKPIQPEINN